MTLNPIFPLWLTLVVLIAMTIAFLWLEIGRNLKYKALRLVAVTGMMLAIAGLILRPAGKSKETNTAMLLTEGFSASVADSLARKNPELKIVRSEGTDAYKKNTPILDYHQLPTAEYAIKAVVGNGLPPYASDVIRQGYEFYPPKPNGLVSLFIPEDVQRNSTQHLQGQIYIANDSSKLFLENEGTKLDSIGLKKGLQYFDFVFTPRVTGNMVYKLTTSFDSIERSIPFHANSPHPINALILQNYPAFETQYLKNFLGDRGHRLALRYQLSKGIYRYEFTNRKEVAINRISQQALTEFDLLIVESDALAGLSSPEKTAIHAAVGNGLGLLVLLSNATTKNLDQEWFAFDFKRYPHDTTAITLGRTTHSLPAAPVRPSSALISSTFSNKSGVLNGYAYNGRGKIGFQLLQETYRLLLAGDSINYSKLWSPLIDNISRNAQKKSDIRIETPYPWYADEPFKITLISSEEEPKLFTDSVRIPLIEDEALDDIWHATAWSRAAGWHMLTSDTGDTLDYFIFREGDLKDLRANETIKSNLVLSRAGKLTDSILVDKMYSALPFFLLLIISGGLLWLAPKL